MNWFTIDDEVGAWLTVTSAGVSYTVLLDLHSTNHTGGWRAQPARLFLSAKLPPTFAVLNDPAKG